MSEPITILSTKKLRPSDINSARSADITVVDEDFIEINILSNPSLTNSLTATHSHLVFTSARAVEGYLKNVDGLQAAKKYIFCLEGETLKAASAIKNTEIKGKAANASALAELIAEQKNIDAVSFICGNIRRNELPDTLQKNKITVEEITVYTTELTPHKIHMHYDGVAFFSPSAAESFFSINKLPDHTPCFCIGNTTETAVKAFTKNNIITAREPGRQSILQSIAEYYSTQITANNDDNSTGKRTLHEEQ